MFCLTKIKDKVKDLYKNLYNFKPTNPDEVEIENAIGTPNIKTLTPDVLIETEKQKNMNEIEFCMKKQKIILHPGVRVLLAHSIEHFGLP